MNNSVAHFKKITLLFFITTSLCPGTIIAEPDESLSWAYRSSYGPATFYYLSDPYLACDIFLSEANTQFSQYSNVVWNISDSYLTNTIYGPFFTCRLGLESGAAKPNYLAMTMRPTLDSYALYTPPTNENDNTCPVQNTNPIYPVSGKKFQHEKIIELQAVQPLFFDLYYNSNRIEKWRHSYSRTLKISNSVIDKGYDFTGAAINATFFKTPDSDGGMGFNQKPIGKTASNQPVLWYRTPKQACETAWSSYKSKYHYSWIDTASASYLDEGLQMGKCKIFDTSNPGTPTERMTLNIFSKFSGQSRIPLENSVEPTLLQFTRNNGSEISFREDNNEWINLSNTNEKVESVYDGDALTGYHFYTYNNAIENYNTQGRLLSIRTIDGHLTTLDYSVNDETGNTLLDKVANETGETISFEYQIYNDQYNRISAVNDHTGRRWIFTYDDNNNPQSIENPDGTIKRYHYEDERLPNHLTGITDESETRYATWQYDSDGRAILSAHGEEANINNVTIDYQYNGTRQVEHNRQMPDGTSSIISTSIYTTHGGNNNVFLASITDPDCADCSVVYEHDPATGNLLYKSEHGVTTRFNNYTNTGTPQEVIHAAGTNEEKITSYVYDELFEDKPKLITEASVYPDAFKTTQYTYDNNGNLTFITINGFRPDGTAISRQYNMIYAGPYNQLSAVDGPRTDVNDIYRLDYYADEVSAGNNRARLQAVHSDDGIYLRNNIRYTSTGKIEAEERLNNLQISYSYYPGNDRLQSMQQTDTISGIVRTTYWTYLPTGEVQSITQGAGSINATTLSFGYDDGRRLTAIADGLGNYIQYTLDSEGNVQQENIIDASGALKKVLSQTFDSYNNLRSQVQLNENQTINFNPNGTLDTITDGKNSTRKYEYDNLLRLTKITQDQSGENSTTANALTQFIYDVQDNLTTVIDATNRQTQYIYDDLGNLLTHNSPDTGSINYSHDTAGNITQLIDAKNQTFNYTYNAQNKLTTIDAPGTEDDVSYAYNNCQQGYGKLCATQRHNSALNYRYNAFGEIISIDQSLQTWPGYNNANNTLSYHYDTAGRVNKLIYPSGSIIHYSHNAAGKIDNVSLEQDGIITSLSLNINYLPFGEESIQTYGNGINIFGFYDTAYRTVITGNGSTYFDFQRSFDNNGNVETSTTLNGLEYMSQNHIYDEHNRLVSSNGDKGNFNYNYDLIGNRTNTNSATDNNGNLTNLRGMSLSFTTDNRLKAVNTGVRFEYNGNGERSMKHSAASGLAGTYGYTQSTSYIYGINGQLLAEIGPTGKVKKEYIYLNNKPLAMLNHQAASTENILNADIDKDGEISVEDFITWYFNHQSDPAYDVTGDGIIDSNDTNAVISCALSQDHCTASSITTELYYIHNDHLGTPKLLTNSNGQTVWRAIAAPFGKASVNNDVDGDGVAVEFNIRQPGQYYDRESGLYYNYFRYYDAETGRYITSDPIGLNGGINTYTYVRNNPLKYVDPYGLWAINIDLYAGPGGGITIGQNENSGDWFGGGRLGLGFGGGISLDINNNGPAERQLRDGPNGDSCNAGTSGTSIGTFAGLGAGVGPYSVNYGANAGRQFDGSGGSYFNDPGFNSPVSLFGGPGVSFGGAFGFEVIGF